MKLDKFRLALRHEAQTWCDEGIISSDQYQQLASRYQFEQVDHGRGMGELGKSTLLGVIRDASSLWLIALGSAFVGVGMILFAIASWNGLAHAFKVILLLGVLFLINSLGFWLWRGHFSAVNSLALRRQFIGKSLILLGWFVLAVNILVSNQEFNLQLSQTQIFLLTAMGGFFIAFSLGFTFLGLLSLGLFTLAYWLGISDGAEFAANTTNWSAFLIQHLHLLILVGGGGLAYSCRSRLIFTTTAILFTWIFAVNISNLTISNNIPLINLEMIKTGIIILIPPTIFWSFDDASFKIYNLYNPSATRLNLFSNLSRTLALLMLSSWFYLFSWQSFWQTQPLQFLQAFNNRQPNLIPVNLFNFFDLLILLALISWQLWFRWCVQDNQQKRLGQDAVVVGLIFVAASAPFLSRLPVDIKAIFFNSLLAGMGVAILGYGILSWRRLPFWGGVVLLALQITSRVGEYTNNLVAIALTLIGCGLGMTLAGIWFEGSTRSMYYSPRP